MNNIYPRLLQFISEERESFDMLIEADNVLGLNVTSEDIINFLDFTTAETIIPFPCLGNIIITEGDILSVLKIIHDITRYEGEYILYINEDNIGTITYLVSRANMIYKELGLNLNIKIDYSENYNSYLNELVNIVGSEDFVETASLDFTNVNKVII